MFLSNYIINKEVKGLYGCYLTNTHFTPHRRSQKPYSIQKVKQRETPNLGKDLAATKKTLKSKQPCSPAMGWLKPGKNPPK